MRITVLAGGLSPERDVSLSTSVMVAAALRQQGHQVAVVDLFLGVEEPITDMDAFFAAGGTVHEAGIADDDIRRHESHRDVFAILRRMAGDEDEIALREVLDVESSRDSRYFARSLA